MQIKDKLILRVSYQENKYIVKTFNNYCINNRLSTKCFLQQFALQIWKYITLLRNSVSALFRAKSM